MNFQKSFGQFYRLIIFILGAKIICFVRLSKNLTISAEVSKVFHLTLHKPTGQLKFQKIFILSRIVYYTSDYAIMEGVF
jgi:hypothetical protein